MSNNDLLMHVKGESIFLDDMSISNDTLFAAVFSSTIAHGKIISLNVEEANKISGVKKIITAKDIPGINQIGNIIQDETLLAENVVEYIGEPIAIIIAESELIARNAREYIKIQYEELEPITNPREASKKGLLIKPPVIFSSGDVNKAFETCDYIIEDSVEIGGQEHLYLETQGAYCVPVENGGVKIYSSTQGPTAVQKAASNILGLPMNKIEVDVNRLGGGFGGKEDQATPWAVMCALASLILNRPVKLILNRKDDLLMTGKRHPYSADFKIGFNNDGKILAYKPTFFQNSGACADLSPAVLERTLFHSTGSYYVPNVKSTGIACKTNLPPNTAFRGFGGPQGMFVMEAAISMIAKKLQMPAYKIQQINLIKDNQEFFYGQKAKNSTALRCWNEVLERYNFKDKLDEVSRFNKLNKLEKKGIALMPVCFGISFTSSFMNQASALIHIYRDGSIGVSTAAVEMGQGVNEKMKGIISKIFSLSSDKIKIESTNTTRVANTSPTAASSAADLNGNAVLIASKNLKKRLIEFASQNYNVDSQKLEFIDNELSLGIKNILWEELINDAFMNRISLSAQAFYSTPEIYFDRNINKGKPFGYHVYGTAIITSTVDCLRGIYKINSVEIVHDFGKSLNKQIDLGQVEGALVQGIGWMTIEELSQNSSGKLLSNSLSTYKIPDIFSAPEKISVHFLEDVENPYGPFKSKAIGEPPLMYGIASYFSILDAMKQFNPDMKIKINSPITHEKVLLGLLEK